MAGGDQVTYFGVTDFRNKKTKFGIKKSDRSRHVYVIGKTGMGKSTLLENMAAQDILNGEGMCFVDPHGSAIDTLLEYVPESRINDVVYFAPFDTDYPISFNVMEDVGADSRHLVVNGLMASFKKIWQDAWSARMEYILTNTLLALLEYPDSTLLGVNRMLAEKAYRDEVLNHVSDASVKAFWIDEFGKWDPRYAREAAAAIQNKIGQFTANPLIRNIIGQSKSSFDIREIMDKQKILLVNLSKGRIGEQNAKLLGGMLITKIYLAAMSRAEVGVASLKSLPDFFFYVDEFQNFATESFADILSEARKYKLNLTIAHQYVAQMQDEVRDAVVGNVGTMITFRIGAEDAELFEKQFAPVFTAEDIVNLGKFQIYLSLMIDGIGSKPFSALTLGPVDRPGITYTREVVDASRRQYTNSRTNVEAAIAKWFEPVNKPERRVIGGASPSGESPNRAAKKTSVDTQPVERPREKPSNSFIIRKEQDSSSNQTTRNFEEQDEHEAELEMKQIVSPRLNNLLEKLDMEKGRNQEQDKKISSVIKNIKNKGVSMPPTSKTSRKADDGTRSSLRDVLSRAMKHDEDSVQEARGSNQTPRTPNYLEKKSSGKDVSDNFSGTTLPPTKERVSGDDKKPSPDEVPEDLLKNILS